MIWDPNRIFLSLNSSSDPRIKFFKVWIRESESLQIHGFAIQIMDSEYKPMFLQTSYWIRATLSQTCLQRPPLMFYLT